MAGMVRSRLTQKCDHKKPRHVEGRQEGYARDCQKRRDVITGRGQNLVLAPKSSERRAGNESQRSNEKSPERDGHFLLEPPHTPDVLLVVETMDNRTGS